MDPDVSTPPPSDVTALLLAWGRGDADAREELIPLVYAELRRLAGRAMATERREHTLEPTALVHETYLKLVRHADVPWQSRAHFFGVAARLMRQILVDHARLHKAEKRGGGKPRLTLDSALAAAAGGNEVELLALDEALTELTRIDEEQGRIVELRFFGALSVSETAEALGISPATVKRDWAVARAWLFRRLAPA
jgi:RNA polymerase sigma factor (TIGR02999 family)